MPELSKEKSMALLVITVMIALMGGYILDLIREKPCDPVRKSIIIQKPLPADTGTEQTKSPGGKSKDGSIVIYICGEVKSPGVYSLPPRSMIFRAVEAAGGMTPDADPEGINLAKEIMSQEMIRIPAKGKTPVPGIGSPDAGDGTSDSPGREGLININRAGEEELESLPGVGFKMARRIVEHRARYGPFSRTEELKNVPGIHEKNFRKIVRLISI